MAKTEVSTAKAPAAIGPYAQAIKDEHYVFTSGQLGINPATGKFPEGVTAQAKQSLENLKAILEEAGSSMEQVMKTTVYLADMNDFAAVNGVYEQYFTKPYPGRSAVQVAKLPKGGLVEIEAVARL